MLPSLSRLPVGAPGPVELERDFTHMYLLRSTNDEHPEPRGVINGRVLNARGDPEHIMDEAERWRREQLERSREYADPELVVAPHPVSQKRFAGGGFGFA